jgi:hypothetical protein
MRKRNAEVDSPLGSSFKTFGRGLPADNQGEPSK